MKHFFILGNGHSGSSLLRGILDCHSKVHVDFENFEHKKLPSDIQFVEWEKAKNEAVKNNKIYGNKIPIEQFITAHWVDDDIIKILDSGYCVIWLQRRYSKYNGKRNTDEQELTYKGNWEWGQSLYWKMKEKYPTKIIYISFEDLLFQPFAEVYRLCCFLDIDFEHIMIADGPSNTGHYGYINNIIDITRI